jgi:hypothetical protein
MGTIQSVIENQKKHAEMLKELREANEAMKKSLSSHKTTDLTVVTDDQVLSMERRLVQKILKTEHQVLSMERRLTKQIDNNVVNLNTAVANQCASDTRNSKCMRLIKNHTSALSVLDENRAKNSDKLLALGRDLKRCQTLMTELGKRKRSEVTNVDNKKQCTDVHNILCYGKEDDEDASLTISGLPKTTGREVLIIPEYFDNEESVKPGEYTFVYKTEVPKTPEDIKKMCKTKISNSLGYLPDRINILCYQFPNGMAITAQKKIQQELDQGRDWVMIKRGFSNKLHYHSGSKPKILDILKKYTV